MIAAVALAAATPALPPNFPKGTQATIEQVRADPHRWNGRWVQVSGWMHRCSRLDCAIFEQPLGGGMSLSFQAADTLDRWIGPLLPAEVVVVARIDSECLLNHCTDRAPILRDPFVMTLRWNVSNLTKDQ